MIITLTGASGVGKTSIAKKLLEFLPAAKLVLSITTRTPRDSDLPGEYRTGVSFQEFEERAQRSEFLWTVDAHGNRYGTFLASVDDALANLSPSLMILVPNAVAMLRDYVIGQGIIVSFYVLSPNEQELRRRHALRNEAPEIVENRIADCATWDAAAKHSRIPYRFIRNDDPDTGIEIAARAIAEEIEGLQEKFRELPKEFF